MAKVTREFCDVCGVEFQARQDKHGLVVTVGHSPCGWGHRENVLNFSGEVCGGCYGALGLDIALAWKRRRDDRATLAEPSEPDLPKAKALPRVGLMDWIKQCLKPETR